jgi:hypothetical protein
MFFMKPLDIDMRAMRARTTGANGARQVSRTSEG